MNQEELKQQLIELIASKVCNRHVKDTCLTKWSDGCGECEHGRNFQIGDVADHLIANGVTIREHGEWKDNHCTVCGMTPIGEETWTNHDITPPKFEWFMDFCPHCGVDMRGVKDECL